MTFVKLNFIKNKTYWYYYGFLVLRTFIYTQIRNNWDKKKIL